MAVPYTLVIGWNNDDVPLGIRGLAFKASLIAPAIDGMINTNPKEIIPEIISALEPDNPGGVHKGFP